jgi:hypothetical protein
LHEFQQPADHHESLDFFLSNHGIMEPMTASLGASAENCLAACRSLDAHIRAMAVFSREEELSGILGRTARRLSGARQRGDF